MSVSLYTITVPTTIGTSGAGVDLGVAEMMRKVQLHGAAGDVVTIEGSPDNTIWTDVLACSVTNTNPFVTTFTNTFRYFRARRDVGTTACSLFVQALASANLLGTITAVSLTVPTTVGSSGANATVSGLGAYREIILSGTAGDQVRIQASPDGTNFHDLTSLIIPTGQTAARVTVIDPSIYYRAVRDVGTTAATCKASAPSAAAVGPSGALSASAMVVTDSAGAVTADSTLASYDTTSNTAETLLAHSATNHALYATARSRGTAGAPTIVADADVLGRLLARGYDGAAYQDGAAIDIIASTDNSASIAAGSMPTAMRFYTTPSGAVTLSERMRLDNRGFLGIGTTAPQSLLDLEADTANAVQTIGAHGTGVAANVSYQRSRGTRASPTVVQDADVLGRMQFYGYDGAGNYRGGAQIQAAASTDNGASISSTSMPSVLTLFTTANSSTTPTERVRIDNRGFVGINQTAPAEALSVVRNASSAAFVASFSNGADAATANGVRIRCGQNTFSAATDLVRFERPDGTTIGTIQQNATATVAFNTTSDARLKDGIRETERGLDDVLRVLVRDYVYRDEPSATHTGFVAQELVEVLPEAVTVGGDDPRVNPWGVDYGKVVPVLLRAVQQLAARVAELEQR